MSNELTRTALIQRIMRSVGPIKVGQRRVDSYQKVRSFVAKRLHGNASQIAWKARSNLLVNLGCGEKTVPGWVNVDYQWNPNLEICWDITKPLPIPDNSCAGLFSEHCLEHFTKDQATRILSESFRILQSGGVLRIAVPDIEMYIDLYNADREGQEVVLPYSDKPCRVTGYNPLMALNRVFREHGHLYAYDYRELSSILANLGFNDIVKSDYRMGRDPRLLIDSADRQPESLYVECAKP